MKARATLLGHPIHQMLIVVPLGLFVIAVVFDVINAFRPIEELSIASFWNILAGAIGAVIAAVFGLIDWTKIPDGSRAKKFGIYHGITNVAVLALFVAAAVMRWDNVSYVATTPALLLELGGFVLGGLGGWLGGELVDRFGIGVHEGAHPNATTSAFESEPEPAVSMRDDDPRAPTIAASMPEPTHAR
jgi:uncharacterized membrane protein